MNLAALDKEVRRRCRLPVNNHRCTWESFYPKNSSALGVSVLGQKLLPQGESTPLYRNSRPSVIPRVFILAEWKS